MLKSGGENPIVLTRIASPDYFRTMGIRFVEGRGYQPGEQRQLGGLFPLVVNEEFARLHWPGVSNVIGRRVAYNGSAMNTWMTVIGVVKDARHYGLSEPMRPGLYLPLSILDSTGIEAAVLVHRPLRRRAGRTRSGNPRHTAFDQPGLADHPVAHHAECARCIPRRPTNDDDRARLVRRHRADAVDRRCLRRAVVRRRPAASGDRHPHGARRATPRGGSHGGDSRCAAHRTRARRSVCR